MTIDILEIYMYYKLWQTSCIERKTANAPNFLCNTEPYKRIRISTKIDPIWSRNEIKNPLNEYNEIIAYII